MVLKIEYAIVAITLLVLAMCNWQMFEYPLLTGSHCAECSARIAVATTNEKLPLDDIFNPLFNVREAAKQMLLLEDHLNTPNRRCDDCISKHMLTIEAFLDEAVNLDRHSRYTELLLDKPAKFKEIERKFIATKDYLGVAQDLRRIRKQFMDASFSVIVK